MLHLSECAQHSAEQITLHSSLEFLSPIFYQASMACWLYQILYIENVRMKDANAGITILEKWPEKIFWALNGTRTHDLCVTGAGSTN